MKFSSYKQVKSKIKQEAFAVTKASWRGYSLTPRYSRTRTCIISSRSILQIRVRAF